MASGTQGRSTVSKTPIMGMFQRGGEVRVEVVDNTQMRTVEQKLIQHCQIGSKVFTDEFGSYNRVKLWFNHESVSHSAGEYVRAGGIHSNTAESFWALFKRGYIGIYHWMSPKHLQRYVDEFVYRFNTKESDFHALFQGAVASVASTTNLPYKVLTA